MFRYRRRNYAGPKGGVVPWAFPGQSNLWLPGTEPWLRGWSWFVGLSAHREGPQQRPLWDLPARGPLQGSQCFIVILYNYKPP